MNNLNSFREYIIKAARDVFYMAKSRDEEVVPVAFILRGEQTVVVPTMPWMRNGATKDELMRRLAMITEFPGVNGIAMVNEVWTAETPMSNPDFTLPSERPDRGEALMIRLEFRGHGVELWKAVISKDRELGEFMNSPFEDGRMVQPLFPKPEVN